MQSRPIPIIIIFSVLLFGVFGFLSFGLGNHEAHSSCPLIVADGGGCLPLDTVVAFAVHHLSGLKNLSRFVLTSDSSLLPFLVFFLTLILLVFAKTKKKPREYYIQKIQTRHLWDQDLGLGLAQRLARWLALLEKRDPDALFIGRMPLNELLS